MQQQALVLGIYDSARMEEAGRAAGGDIYKRGYYHGYYMNKVSNFGERLFGLQVGLGSAIGALHGLFGGSLRL